MCPCFMKCMLYLYIYYMKPISDSLINEYSALFIFTDIIPYHIKH